MLWTDNELGEKIVVPLASLLPEGSEWLLYSPNDMNDAGQIVGVGWLLSDLETGRPFRYTPGDETQPAIVEDLSTIGIVRTEDINSLGHVVGSTADSVVVYTGVPGTLDADDLMVIPAPANGSNLQPNAINDLGQVTGSVTVDGAKYAFRYTPPTAESAAEFITFAFSDDRSLVLRSNGLDINHSGQVVGYSYVVNKRNPLDYRPFLYSDDIGIEDFTGLKGMAEAINDEGDVTGWGTFETGSRGFIYLDGLGTFNLDDMVVGEDADLAVWNADPIRPAAINNPVDLSTSGEISGYISTGADVPFLLTPQPLP